MNKVIVIGGGAAGMMAAIVAARNGSEVLLLEHKDRIGNKILATGNGKCNLTNRLLSAEFYRGNHPEFVEELFEVFGIKETIQFFLELGIYTKNRNGYLYPYSDQAASVLDALRFEIRRLQIQVILECHILDIKKSEFGEFMVKTDQAGILHSTSVIIATGSMAAPKTGSDGSGYKIAKKLGIPIRKPVPALVQLRSPLKIFKSISGIRMDTRLTVVVNGSPVDSDRGELQITEYGISGIPTFQISGTAARAIEEQKEVEVAIDFMPDFTKEYLYDFLKNRFDNSFDKTNEECLVGLFPKKMISFFLKECQISLNSLSQDIKKEQLNNLCYLLKEFRVPIEATNGFENAQTCSGGVLTECLTNKLEARNMNGLYFAGEIIDIDGLCGGYNLQWAWTSGYVAGKSASNDTNQSN